MRQKYLLAPVIGSVILIGIGVFVYTNSSEEINNEVAYDKEQVEAINKDTEFEEARQIEQITCNDYDCFEKHYQDIVVQETIAVAFVDLKARYDESAYVRAFCHPIVHVIGRAAAQKYADVGDAYTEGDHFCWSGYYHGVMEGMLQDTASEDLPNKINAICNGVSGKADYSFDYYNCVHGLGHGVMYITDNELFEALNLCDSLSGGWEKESCYGGVFMENVITDFENHFTKYLKPDDLLYPCTAVKEKNRHSCYLMQTSYILKENGYNFVEAFHLCSTIEEKHIDTCYRSIGRDASGSTVSDIERTKNYCLLGIDYRQQSSCTMGAVRDFISYFHSDIQAKQLCEALPSELHDVCFSTATQYYKSFSQ